MSRGTTPPPSIEPRASNLRSGPVRPREVLGPAACPFAPVISLPASHGGRFWLVFFTVHEERSSRSEAGTTMGVGSPIPCRRLSTPVLPSCHSPVKERGGPAGLVPPWREPSLRAVQRATHDSPTPQASLPSPKQISSDSPR